MVWKLITFVLRRRTPCTCVARGQIQDHREASKQQGDRREASKQQGEDRLSQMLGGMSERHLLEGVYKDLSK